MYLAGSPTRAFPGYCIGVRYDQHVTPRCDAGPERNVKRKCILRALLPELFLDTASGCGMTESVTPRCDAESREERKKECILRALPPEFFLDTASGCGMTASHPALRRGPERDVKGMYLAGSPTRAFPGYRIGVRYDCESPRAATRSPERNVKGNVFCGLSCPSFFWIPHRVRYDCTSPRAATRGPEWDVKGMDLADTPA